MKIIAIMLGLALSLSVSTSYAAYATCYSDNKTIFDGRVKDVGYTDDFITFKEYSSNKEIFVFSNCMIVMEKSDFIKRDHTHAIEKRKK